MKKSRQLTTSLNVLVKRILSYRKRNWDLDDYPIEFTERRNFKIPDTDIVLPPWEARIINGFLSVGFGDTKEEAYKKLSEKFEKRKAQGRKLLRPGKKMKIVFASSSRMGKLEKEATRFFKDVCDFNYSEMFVSDESILSDFCSSKELLAEAIVKINTLYGIQLDASKRLFIADILERMK